MLLGGGLWWRAVACCDYATFFGPKGTFVLASPREKLAEDAAGAHAPCSFSG